MKEADAMAEWISMAHPILKKFATHRRDCGCFICRTLTKEQVTWLHENGYVK